MGYLIVSYFLTILPRSRTKITADSCSAHRKTLGGSKISSKIDLHSQISIVSNNDTFFGHNLKKSLIIDAKTWVTLKKTDWIVFVIHSCLLLKKNFIENERKMILDVFFERQQLIIQPNIRNTPQKVFAISTRKNGKKYFLKFKKQNF